MRIPLTFWKVCALVRKDDGKLSTMAFQMGQPDIEELDGFEEKFDVTMTQLTIEDLEDMTKLSFGVWKDFDRFAQTGSDTLEKTGGQQILAGLDDIVV